MEKNVKTIKNLTEKSQKIITRRPNGSLRVQTINNDPSMTAAEYAEDTDINNIMAKFQKTGHLTHLSSRQGIYSDVSEIPDLLTASIMLKETQEKFNNLPSRIRERFSNDPQEMINFLENPKNIKEAEELGLITRVLKNDDNSNDDDKKATKKSKTDPDSKKSEPE